MKRTILMIAGVAMMQLAGFSQTATGDLAPAVEKLDRARSVKDYQALGAEFAKIASSAKTNWLPFYYAAYCHAKIGWLYENDGDKIEPFANQAEEEVKKSFSLLDTATQKKELAEIYCVLSMINRARVFINPMTYGRQYGPRATNYLQLAAQKDPANPRVLYLEGWEKYATPKAWGGDKNKARELLTAARQNLETAAGTGVQPHWGKTEVEDLLKKIN